jgi:hypothetical protein
MVYDGFEKGLIEYGLSLEDIQSWEYCGGNENAYFNDFVKMFGHMAHPECEVNCVCGHKIVTNCYITNKDFTPTKKMKKIQYQNKEIPILIVGSCCVKQFMEGTKLKCEVCGKLHRRNKCKTNLCSQCDKKIRLETKKKEQDKNRELELKYIEIFRKEQDRKRELEMKCTQCIDCDKKILLKYKRCPPCNTIFKEKKENSCIDCNKAIEEKFERCYTCTMAFRSKE